MLPFPFQQLGVRPTSTFDPPHACVTDGRNKLLGDGEAGVATIFTTPAGATYWMPTTESQQDAQEHQAS